MHVLHMPRRLRPRRRAPRAPLRSACPLPPAPCPRPRLPCGPLRKLAHALPMSPASVPAIPAPACCLCALRIHRSSRSFFHSVSLPPCLLLVQPRSWEAGGRPAIPQCPCIQCGTTGGPFPACRPHTPSPPSPLPWEPQGKRLLAHASSRIDATHPMRDSPTLLSPHLLCLRAWPASCCPPSSPRTSSV